MARKTAHMLPLSPYEKRLRNTNRKLQEALARLLQGLPTHPALQKRPYRLNVTTLAREARVGRNAIYANHRTMIEELRRADRQRAVPDKLATWEDKLAEQRTIIAALKNTERRLTTENAVLLKRALNAEAAAARHQRHNARLIKERDQALKTVVMVPRSRQ